MRSPFGGGKTQTAHELHRRLADSVICDPEHVGFGLHRTLPRQLRGDFQDLLAWRHGVFEVLDLALAGFDATIIVPMTLVEPEYFDQIIGRLRECGHDVRHFALLADRETVLRRLRERGFGRAMQVLGGAGAPPHRETFAVSNLDRCLSRLEEPKFAEHIWTDRLSVSQVADRIAASAGLTLAANTDGAIRGRARRAWIGLKHVRFD